MPAHLLTPRIHAIHHHFDFVASVLSIFGFSWFSEAAILGCSKNSCLEIFQTIPMNSHLVESVQPATLLEK